MQIKSLFNFILFLIIFQAVNRGLVLIPGFDLRAMNIMLMSIMFIIVFFKKFIINKKTFFSVLSVIGIFIYITSTYFINQLSEFEYFIRRLLQLVYVSFIIVFFIVFKNYFILENFKKYFIFSGYVLVLSMFIQLLGIDLSKFTFYAYTKDELPEVTWIASSFKRLSGFAFDPNVASIYLGPLFFISLLNENNRLRLNAHSVIFLLFLLMTFSRGAYLGLLLSFLLYIVLMMSKESKLFIKMVLFFIFFIFLFYMVYGFDMNMLDSSNANRLTFWLFALKGVMESFFMGVGFSNINSFLASNGLWFASVHSAYLHLISELGVVAIILVTVFLFKAFKRANILFSYNKALILIICYLSVVLLFISEHFDPMMYIFIAVIFILYKQQIKEKNEKNIIRS